MSIPEPISKAPASWKTAALTATLTDDGTLTISGTGPMANYNGVTNPKAPWHGDRARIMMVIIEDGVTTIGNSAFSGCTGLFFAAIPNSVKIIETNAFRNCAGLTTITIPKSVTWIENGAFYGCAWLVSIDVGDGSADYNSIDGVLFNEYKTVLIQYPINKAGASYTIPDGVTSIGNYAFNGCAGLASVIIPNCVTSIGNCAFSGCSGLASIDIPKSVTLIGNYAFNGCTGLSSIVIPNGAVFIESNAFCGCTALRSIIIPSSVTWIGDQAFRDCARLASIIVLRQTPPIVDRWTFYGVNKTANLYVPEKSISAYMAAAGWNDFVSINAAPGNLF